MKHHSNIPTDELVETCLRLGLISEYQEMEEGQVIFFSGSARYSLRRERLPGVLKTLLRERELRSKHRRGGAAAS